jgi:hypothetical protein
LLDCRAGLTNHKHESTEKELLCPAPSVVSSPIGEYPACQVALNTTRGPPTSPNSPHDLAATLER